jgi:hypothetical protein
MGNIRLAQGAVAADGRTDGRLVSQVSRDGIDGGPPVAPLGRVVIVALSSGHGLLPSWFLSV